MIKMINIITMINNDIINTINKKQKNYHRPVEISR